MRRKAKRMLPTITVNMACTVLVLWIVCMYAITSATAENFYVLFFHIGQDFMENAWRGALFSEMQDDSKDMPPGYKEYVLWNAVQRAGPGYIYSYPLMDGHKKILRTESVKIDGISAIYDRERKILAYSGNFFIFPYYYEDGYLRGDSIPKGYAVCVLDRQMDTEAAKSLIEESFGPDKLSASYRFTGVLEDGYFTVQSVEYRLDPRRYGTSESEWIKTKGFDAEMPQGAETVTLYANHVEENIYEKSRSFKYEGEKINDLYEFISQIDPSFEVSHYGSRYSFTDFLYTESMYHYDWAKWDGTAEKMPELEYTLTVAMLASPWRAAIAALKNVYIVTFIIVIAGIFHIRRLLKRNVSEPVAAVNRGISEGWINLHNPGDPAFRYVEMSELLSNYDDTKLQLADCKDAVTRLERTVKYAREAEENRRRMTSNIAHELKTPLAVIHSYAEGLKERIAEDKRDKYLEVILSEVQRMDGMVLEMLELSRLEAGKVRLSREDFSLLKLTASVFERLERAFHAKGIKLNLELGEGCDVNADPVRIEQVIINFAANAVKYTHMNGSIWVRLSKSRGRVILAVENESEPLPQEVLYKVWDTFYRADESRTGSGTGLGLAIAKSIIDLHGGKCMARNTKRGVEFSFTLEE